MSFPEVKTGFQLWQDTNLNRFGSRVKCGTEGRACRRRGRSGTRRGWTERKLGKPESKRKTWAGQGIPEGFTWRGFHWRGAETKRGIIITSFFLSMWNKMSFCCIKWDEFKWEAANLKMTHRSHRCFDYDTGTQCYNAGSFLNGILPFNTASLYNYSTDYRCN